MPTFAQWEAARKAGKVAEPAQDSQSSAAPMYQANSGDDYTSAAMQELGRTGKEAAIGLARSPLDAIMGVANTVAHPIDTFGNIAHSVAHPLDTLKSIGDDPRAGGSLLGQLLLGKVVPTNVGDIANVAGRGVSAVGRGMESVGASAPARAAGGFGAMEAALRMDPKGLAVAAAPAALEYGGQGLQKAGSALQGLKKAATPPTAKATVAEDRLGNPGLVREVVNTAREAKTNGATTAQAGQRAGWPLGQSTEVPYRAGSSVTTPDTSLTAMMDDIHVPPDYAAELARASNAQPTPNASAVFNKMAKEGAFGPEQRLFSDPQAFSRRYAEARDAQIQYPIDDTGQSLGPNAYSPKSSANFGDAADMNATYDGVFSKATGSGGRYGGTGDPYPLPSLKALAEVARMR